MGKAENSRIALPVGSNLDRFINKNQEAFKYATGELSQLIRDLAYAGKVVNRRLTVPALLALQELMAQRTFREKNNRTWM